MAIICCKQSLYHLAVLPVIVQCMLKKAVMKQYISIVWICLLFRNRHLALCLLYMLTCKTMKMMKRMVQKCKYMRTPLCRDVWWCSVNFFRIVL
jgi:hypothetical protein